MGWCVFFLFFLRYIIESSGCLGSDKVVCNNAGVAIVWDIGDAK